MLTTTKYLTFLGAYILLISLNYELSAQMIPMECSLSINTANENDIVCDDVPFELIAELNPETDVVSISLNNMLLDSRRVSAENDSSVIVVWNFAELNALDNLEFGTNTFIIVTEDGDTGSACFSDYTFSYESCESVNDSLIDNNTGKFNISLKVLLQGNYDANSEFMTTKANELNLLPPLQPFNSEIFNFDGMQSVTEFENEAVDWVLVSLRNETGEILDKSSALLYKDGSVRSIEGNLMISFDLVSTITDTYWVSVSHKSHLAIISEKAYATNEFIDFTKPELIQGPAQSMIIDNIAYMIAGDLDGNGIINNIDYNIWANNNSAVGQYLAQDIDGNGLVNNIDYNYWQINRQKLGARKIIENEY